MFYLVLKGRGALLAKWGAGLLCAVALLPSGNTQGLGAMKPQYVDALKPLFCGSCVELNSVVRYTATTVAADQVLANTVHVEAATEADLAGSIGVAESTRAKSTHVCVGGSRKVEAVKILPIPDVDKGKQIVVLRVHPDGIDGVCLGALLPIDVFFETVMADIFAIKLKEFDARLSQERLEAMVRSRLADALAKDRALMMEAIKRDVVAELKGKPNVAAGDGQAVDPNATGKVCTSGAFTCKGKTPDRCCRCFDYPDIEGTCDTNATPKSWRPKPVVGK